jgi:TPR repeat protein
MNIPDLRHRAESGSAVAQTLLGICYLEGVEVEADHKEAFRLLSAAANQGASRAMANLAYMYAEGLGTTKNFQEALPLYERAAEAGEFLAQVELARMYARGVVVPANPEMARKWYAAAAAQEASVGDCEEAGGPVTRILDDFGCPIRRFCVWALGLRLTGRVAQRLNGAANLGASR